MKTGALLLALAGSGITAATGAAAVAPQKPKAATAVAATPAASPGVLVYYFPLALEHRSSLWLPALYGLGTGLPVVVFAVLVSAGLAWAGSVARQHASTSGVAAGPLLLL